MDNFTHSLVGLAGAKAGLERTTPYATAVCVLAANLPDADVVTLFGGRFVFLEQHRGLSHSVAGTLTLSVLLALVFYVTERAVAFWRGREPRAKLKGLLLCSLALGASHPLLDWTNNYGVRPLLPWDGRWLYGDLVFILDPWIWLLLGGAAFLLTANTDWKTAAWTVLGFVLTAAILLLPEQRGASIPTSARAAWVAGVVLLVLAHNSGLARRFGGAVAVVALLLVVCYWGALALLHNGAVGRAQYAAQRLAGEEGTRVLKVAAMPMPADPTRWRCVAETERTVYRFDVSNMSDLGRTNERRYPKPRGAEAEQIARVSQDPRARVFLNFARFPLATLRREADGRALVQFVDIRFSEPGPPAPGDSFKLELPVPSQ